MMLAAFVAHAVMDAMGMDCVITSATDSTHGRAGLHYVGYAIDLRIRDMSARDINASISSIMEALGPEFDVLLETNHIHIEFQPK